MEFRPRNYDAERESHSFPRARADTHPLCSPAASHDQADAEDHCITDFSDPLRGPDIKVTDAFESLPDTDYSSSVATCDEPKSKETAREWNSFKRFLTQRFPVSKMISISLMSDGIMRSSRDHEKSLTSLHLEELDDPQKFAEEGTTLITRQEYVFRLSDLKKQIVQAWHSEDRVAALKLAIKVARLLTDTSVKQFYTTLFVLVTDVLDMLGDMVWERVKKKTEFTEDGRAHICLAENFGASSVCLDARETCHNWFCKIGSIRELLPRIYLELAILPCWRFLVDQPANCLHRLVKMMRGLADPVASAYCRLYMAHRARELPSHDTGYLISCMNDINVLLVNAASSVKDDVRESSKDYMRLLISLIEPTVEYIMHRIVEDATKEKLTKALVDLGLGGNRDDKAVPCVSIVVHCLLKELPADTVRCRSKEIIGLIECCNDYSLDKCSNYRLLGFRLSESTNLQGMVDVVDHVIQVSFLWDKLDEYLHVMDAFLDLVLQNQLDKHLIIILEGIAKRAHGKAITDNELGSLQSILLKLLSHFKDLEDVFAFVNFLEILDMMHGSPQSIVYMHILNSAVRKGHLCNLTTIELLLGICKALMDEKDQTSMREYDYQQPSHLITQFVCMVDYGEELEQKLAFLVECRGAFGSTNELKEALVCSSNSLAMHALKDANKQYGFIKSCIAFSEITIPSISSLTKQSNLYLETAEVALLAGLVAHAEGLIDSAFSCLQTLLVDGSPVFGDVDGILSSFQKLCGILVIVPGNHDRGINYIPKSLLAITDCQSCMTPRATSRIFTGIILLSATLAQKILPYHADNLEIPGNDLLFYGDSIYLQELESFASLVVQKVVDVIDQEPSSVARGSMALEVCNCMASSFRTSPETSSICLKLLETAKLCLGADHNYIKSTIKFLETFLPISHEMCRG